MYHLANKSDDGDQSPSFMRSKSDSRSTISRISARVSNSFQKFAFFRHSQIHRNKESNENQHTISPVIRHLTRASIITYQLFTAAIIISLFLLQLGYSNASIYSVAVAFGLTAIGKHSMYALFTYRLRNTFRNTPTFRVSHKVTSLIFITVGINCLAYLSQPYWYVEFRLHNNYMLWFLGLATIPVEMVGSFLILGNFATRLLKVKLFSKKIKNKNKK